MRSTPLIVVGIDAGDPGFLETWARRGDLPTLGRLLERGCRARTGGAELISEHGAWRSLVSGVSRRDHGYFYYRQLEPGTYDLRTVTGLDVEAPPFWSALVGQGRSVAVIDVPEQNPVPGLAGVQLAHWATHNNWNPDAYHPSSEPPAALAEVQRLFAPRLLTREQHDSTAAQDRRLREELLARVATKGAACRHLLSGGRYDLVVVVFAESHAANHQFWRHRPEIAGEARPDPVLAGAIRDVYRAIDLEIGALLAGQPSDSDVVVVSSVGMADDFPTTGLIEAFLRRLGYQASPRGPVAPARPGDRLRRAIPERWRRRLGRHLPRATRERLLAEGFRSATDWSRTTAFAIPSAYTSFVRVNLRGREPLGTVSPGREYDRLLDRIEADLAALLDPATGEPAVELVSRTTTIFDCDPHPTLPDLWVEWTPGRFLERVVHPRAELVQDKPDFYRRSDHSSQGFFAATGPSFPARGDLGEIDVLDLAPTFLALLGAPVPAAMTGRPIVEAAAR